MRVPATAATGADPSIDRTIEEQVFQRVLDALLREDHLGLSSNGHRDGDEWCTHTGRGEPRLRLRLPVRPDGFQHHLRSSRPMLLAQRDGQAPVLVDDLDALLTVLAPADDAASHPATDRATDAGTAPSGDPQARSGWAAFVAECHGELTARRLAAQRRSRVHARVAAARAGGARGMAGALLEETLAAHADHPVHPTSRCRHGLDEAELLAYAPEHAPTFALRWLPASRAAVTLTGRLPPWWPGSGDPRSLLLPVHPLTADRLGLPAVDGPRVLVRPTLSMRTLALTADPYTHLKLPLPTATLGARNRRTIAPGTLADGDAVHRLLRRIAAGEPRFADKILHADETTYGHAGDDTRAFLLRRYPRALADSTVVPVAALAAPDPCGASVVERVAGGDPLPLLEGYLDLLLDWHTYLWLRHGIALEAHQQNIHLVVDPGGGVRLLYKDNDGARLDSRHAVALGDPRMRIADPGELADVFTTITLHLCAAAPLLALAGRGVPAPTPAAALRHRLVAARDRWGEGADARRFTERVLDADTLPIKAMVTAGTLLPKERLGCADVNKYYLRTGPNYLRDDPATADVAASHTLLGCLHREVCAPERQTVLAGGYAMLRLPRSDVLLRCRVARVSEVGAHRYRGPVQRRSGTGWSAVTVTELATLVGAELRLRTGVANEEFVAQVTASRDALERVLRQRPATDPYRTGDPVIDAYVDSEQSLVHGHPRHPAPKWRSGDTEAWDAYAPELRGRLQPHWIGVPRDLLAEDGPADQLIDALGPPPAPPGHVPLPVHPWQYRLAGALDPRLRDLGVAGAWLRPTASVRTLYAPEADLFVKTSLHVRITNCLRKNARYELTGAHALTRLLAGIPLAPGAALLPEPAYRTVDVPGLDETFGVILRGGLRPHLRPGETPVLAAALAAGPLRVTEPVGWWRDYAGLLVPAVLGLWGEHGVVHEAHLQNVVVVLDADRRPVRMLLRDLEGVKLDAARRCDWLAQLPGSVAYRPEQAYDRLMYCLFVNHLAELAGALADAHPGIEARLWSTLRQVVAAASRALGEPPQLRAVLAGVPLPAKANLLVRWHRDADRRAGYVPFPNPMGPTP